MSWFKDLFVDEAKSALSRRYGAGGGSAKTLSAALRECTDFSNFNVNNARAPIVDSMDFDDTINGTSFNSFFHSCKRNRDTIPLFNTSNGTDFTYMFWSCWSITTIPRFNTSNGTNFSHMFHDCGALTSIPELDFSKGTSFQRTFNLCVKLTTVPPFNTKNGQYFDYMFFGCNILPTIPLLCVDNAKSFAGTFQNCNKLVNLKLDGTIKINGFDVSTSPLLSHVSLMGIINALADKTSDTSTTWKVTLGSANLEKLTDDEKLIAQEKGWTLA